MRKTARSVNLMAAGLLAGNELGTWAAVHPALKKLGPPERVRAEQELTRRFGVIMPFWMAAAVISCLPNLALSAGRPGFRPTLIGALCFAAMLASTRLGNVPINNRTLEIDPEEDIEEFGRLRERWDRLHTLRIALTTAGLGFLVAGALTEEE
ncbi:MAG: DUF1772 domain-containing protein [Rubrobacter sp.]|nr:DUF1772 domain-containing protein [Rubrobacter sp.]